MSRADLHTHTTASDGLHRPAENVAMAAEAGLTAIAITDHDTVAGLDEAREEGAKRGIEVVPGVELSTAHEGQDIHILGYYVDDRDPLLLERLAFLRSVRERRNAAIVERLNELGVRITLADVQEAAGAGRSNDETIGRPHIAEALVRVGAVGSVQEAFDRYLAEGQPACVTPARITPEQAIGWIREAGGTAIVAHPGLYGADDLVERLLADGIADGLEAYHSDHDEADSERYAAMAIRYGKLITGGSDFHGARKGKVYHGVIGHRTIDAAVLPALRAPMEARIPR